MRKRILAAALIALAAGGLGYVLHQAPAGGAAQTISAPPANSIRVIYSLDAKQNDKEIITLIDGAKRYVYFAMYEFTLQDIADALVAAKQRGIDVEGVVDAGESANSYDAPVIAKVRAAGIPVATQHHADGNGIMHIKALATDGAYAIGSYNWTGSATSENDELLEIGTDSSLVATYTKILKRLIDEYNTGAAAVAAPVSGGTYDYTEASAHIGEYASVRGAPVDAYTSASGTVFLDYCKSYKSCPFSAVVFANDAKKFGDLSRYAGHMITVTGQISSYQSHAEIVLSNPGQISE